MSELRIGEASAELRASLRPIEWMVLEELALAADADETGRLVAPTNARAVAERLGLTAGAVARALASLGAAGLVSHVRHSDPSGRFGPSNYVLSSLSGLEVVGPGPAPCGDSPCSGAPCVESPHMVAPSMGDQRPADTACAASRRARRDTSPMVEDDQTMTSGPNAAADAGPAAKKRGRSGQAQPPHLDDGLQLELLSSPPSGPATKRSREDER